jgi:DNA-binding MarR family transcriptional regulator/GNAT superfamily N-acetyltransferase
MNAKDLVSDVRGFNRFYTRELGVLNEGFLGSGYSLTEGRVIYELARLGTGSAVEIREELGLDHAYLSRLITSFEQRGLIQKQKSEADARKTLLSLTARGNEEFGNLNSAQQDQIQATLRPLSKSKQVELVSCMRRIQELLSGNDSTEVTLRRQQPGDIGWIIEQHGRLYFEEYGWNEECEALTAEIAAHFLRNFDPSKERCWIAERLGERVGCVCIVKHPERPSVARLRLLLVTPHARGYGVGKTLVHTCTEFARQAGYEKITLWTNSVLTAARKLYIQEGYQLVHENPYHNFGQDLVEQTWELTL